MPDNILNLIDLEENQELTNETGSVFSIVNKKSTEIQVPNKTTRSRKTEITVKKRSLKKVRNSIFVSVSEAAKIGGIKTKTIRRAIQSEKVIYTVDGNRYQIDLSSMLNFLFSNKKLKNKLNESGIGQFIDKWRT